MHRVVSPTEEMHVVMSLGPNLQMEGSSDHLVGIWWRTHARAQKDSVHRAPALSTIETLSRAFSEAICLPYMFLNILPPSPSGEAFALPLFDVGKAHLPL